MRMHVRPAREGLIVLDPTSYHPLPPAGAEVPRSSYWLRRLADGDVVLVEKAPRAPATASAARSSAPSPRE